MRKLAAQVVLGAVVRGPLEHDEPLGGAGARVDGTGVILRRHRVARHRQGEQRMRPVLRDLVDGAVAQERLGSGEVKAWGEARVGRPLRQRAAPLVGLHHEVLARVHELPGTAGGALRPIGGEPLLEIRDLRVVAVGWATVELDRAAAELGAILLPGTTFTDARASVHLGAACRIGRVRPGAAQAEVVVLLEPYTEGRLAATLARHDEGWRATWLAAEGSLDLPLSVERAGPLGEERLILDGPLTGPHRLVVTAATLAP